MHQFYLFRHLIYLVSTVVDDLSIWLCLFALNMLSFFLSSNEHGWLYLLFLIIPNYELDTLRIFHFLCLHSLLIFIPETHNERIWVPVRWFGAGFEEIGLCCGLDGNRKQEWFYDYFSFFEIQLIMIVYPTTSYLKGGKTRLRLKM